MKKSLGVGVVVSVIVVGLCGGAGAVTYQAPIDLGPGQAWAINNSGQAVGHDAYSFYGGGNAVHWENGSTVPTPLTNLPYPYNDWSTAVNINDQGQVVGSSNMAGTYQGQAVLWETKTANPTPLGFLPGHDNSGMYVHAPCGINYVGQVVGTSNVYTNWDTSRAFLWENGGPMQSLGTVDAWPRSGATAINDLGVVVGPVGASGGLQRATSWYDGVWGYLGELPGDLASGVYDINDLGQAVGYSGQSTQGGHAVLWSGGVVQSLHPTSGPLSGYTYTTARAINNSGQVVGHLVNDTNSPYHYQGQAFVWQCGSIQALPLLDGYNYATALGVNDLGQIVGFAGDGYNDGFRAVLWNPVPEPSGLIALGSGLAGLGGMLFRRRPPSPRRLR